MAKRKSLLTLPSFPNSKVEPFVITSSATGNYNCIAWASEDTEHFYWPIPEPFFSWHNDAIQEETIEAFVSFFQLCGYVICEHGKKEKGVTKVALFAKDNIPTHAARQLPNGSWTSKLGILEDVRHSLFAISEGLYGDVVLYLKRKN